MPQYNGTPGNDLIIGLGQDDSITGGGGADSLFGGAGADTIEGGDGDDLISSTGTHNFSITADYGLSVDHLSGGAGNDQFVVGWGDYVDGGTGTDDFFIVYAALTHGVDVDFRHLSGQFTGGGLHLLFVERAGWVGGSAFNDFIAASGYEIDGNGGDDHLIGAGLLFGDEGNDLIEVIDGGYANEDGGAGDDTLHGGYGFDTLSGGDGNDIIIAAGAGDSVVGGNGNDTITGGASHDTIDGGYGDDLITGGGFDNIAGGDGDDTIVAAGRDSAWGGPGDDLVFAGSGFGSFDGGSGIDTISYERVSYGVAVYLDAYAIKTGNYDEPLDSFENLIGSAFNDTLYASDGGSTVMGAAGNDSVFGNSGDDVLYGDSESGSGPSGDDTLVAGDGRDTLVGGGGIDTAWYGMTRDRYEITYHAATKTFTITDANGGDDYDTLLSMERVQFQDGTYDLADFQSNPNGSGDDSIAGTSGADSLEGHAGDDTLTGGTGNDSIDGGVGDDIINGGDGIDTVVFDHVAELHVDLAVNGVQDTGQGRDTLVSIENVRAEWGGVIYGNSANNVLEVSSFGSILDGRGGADTMIGGQGADEFHVDNVGDVVISPQDESFDEVVSTLPTYRLPDYVEMLKLAPGASNINGQGNDENNYLNGNIGNNKIEGLGGNDEINSSGGNDTLDGGEGDDWIIADADPDHPLVAFNNLLIGGDGNDTLYGNSGNDTLVGDSLSDVSASGDDDIRGGDGTDTAQYAEASTQYVITKTRFNITVERPGQGTDTLTDVEYLKFADKTIAVSDVAQSDISPPHILGVTSESSHAFVGAEVSVEVTFDEKIKLASQWIILQDQDGNFYYVGSGTIPDSDYYGNGTIYWQRFNVPYEKHYTLTFKPGSVQDMAGNDILEQSVQFDSGPSPEIYGGSGNDTLQGTAGDDTMHGGAGNDVFILGAGSDQVDGGDGIDTAIIAGPRSAWHLVSGGSPVHASLNGPGGSADLSGVERLQFDDQKVALDIWGNAGKAYRLYQAAFDRKPDIAGLGYQMHDLDIGYSLSQVAGNFIASPEFQSKYGNVDDGTFVTLLYQHVLHRTPQQSEVDYHVNNELHAGYSRAQVLTFFSESPENQANVIGDIQNGMVYTG